MRATPVEAAAFAGPLTRAGALLLLMRLRARATCRGFVSGVEQLVDIIADQRLMLAGATAARLLVWDVLAGSVEANLTERELADIAEQCLLERDEQRPDLLLRPVRAHRRCLRTRVWRLLCRRTRSQGIVVSRVGCHRREQT